MVHRLLNYFYIPAFHGRLKAYYWTDWDHRNLLHVWPFKASHRDGSQVRIYWNQFLSESCFLAHWPSPVWNLHFVKKKQKEGKRETSPWLLEMGNILKYPKCLCVLSSQIKRDFEIEGWRKCRIIVLNQGRNTKTEPVPQRFTSKGASHFVSYLIS